MHCVCACMCCVRINYDCPIQCTSKSTTNVSTSGKKLVFNYSLKVINCAKKLQYHTKPLELSCRCLSLSDFRKNAEDEIGTIEGTIG